MVPTSLRRLALFLCAAVVGGCDLFTGPRPLPPGTAAAPGVAADEAAIRDQIELFTRYAEWVQPTGTLTVQVGGSVAAYTGVVLETVVVPPSDPVRRATAFCRSHRLLLAWRGRPPVDGFYLLGEDFAAPVTHLPPTRCTGADRAAFAPHVMVVARDAERPLIAVAGEAEISPGVVVGGCDSVAQQLARWVTADTVSGVCQRTSHTVRASVALHRRGIWDSTPAPPLTVPGVFRSMRIVQAEVPGVRVIVRCDDPVHRPNFMDCGSDYR